VTKSKRQQSVQESTEESKRIASKEMQLLFKEVNEWRTGKIGEKLKSKLRIINCNKMDKLY